MEMKIFKLSLPGVRISIASQGIDEALEKLGGLIDDIEMVDPKNATEEDLDLLAEGIEGE